MLQPHKRNIYTNATHKKNETEVNNQKIENGGHSRDRTYDHYDVNVVLYRWAMWPNKVIIPKNTNYFNKMKKMLHI